MEVTQEETEEGKVVTLNETGSCCWRGGVRKLLVSSEGDEAIVSVMEQSDESAQISVWDESHDECQGRALRDFDRLCLEWVLGNLVGPEQQMRVKTHPKGLLTRPQGTWRYEEV